VTHIIAKLFHNIQNCKKIFLLNEIKKNYLLYIAEEMEEFLSK